MPKSTVSYWNPLEAANAGLWEPVPDWKAQPSS